MTASHAFTVLLALASCDTATPVPRPGCENPQPILGVAGSPSGYERCVDGSRIRVASVPVDLDWYTEDLVPCTHPTPDAGHHCEEHADCGDDGLNYCLCEHGYWSDTNVCVQVCESDADCRDDAACVAPEQGGSHLDVPSCRSLRCSGPEDCTSGECGAAWAVGDNSAHFGTACRGAWDACRTDAHCGGGSACCWPSGPSLPRADGPSWACEVLYFEE